MEFGYIVIGVIVIGLIYHLTKSEKSSAPVVETKSEVPSTAELKKLTKQQNDLTSKKQRLFQCEHRYAFPKNSV